MRLQYLHLLFAIKVLLKLKMQTTIGHILYIQIYSINTAGVSIKIAYFCTYIFLLQNLKPFGYFLKTPTEYK